MYCNFVCRLYIRIVLETADDFCRCMHRYEGDQRKEKIKKERHIKKDKYVDLIFLTSVIMWDFYFSIVWGRNVMSFVADLSIFEPLSCIS